MAHIGLGVPVHVESAALAAAAERKASVAAEKFR
jgi:hypothetical protein